MINFFNLYRLFAILEITRDFGDFNFSDGFLEQSYYISIGKSRKIYVLYAISGSASCKKNSSSFRPAPILSIPLFPSALRTLSSFAFIPINLEATKRLGAVRHGIYEGEPIVYKGSSRMRLIQKCRRALAPLGTRTRFHDKKSSIERNQTREHYTFGIGNFISRKKKIFDKRTFGNASIFKGHCYKKKNFIY